MCLVFDQLYTIHGYYNGEGMALLWALLPNKSKATYIELFAALRAARSVTSAAFRRF